MKKLIYLLILCSAVGLVITGCEKLNMLGEPIDNEFGTPGPLTSQAPPPWPLVTIDAAGQSLTLWPYTGTDLTDTPQDPVNLIFIGQADPRDLRAALLSLDGDRTAYGIPAEFPFNCTWNDAMGDVQAAYGEPDGWVANTVQLECGAYDQVRFHLRLFRAGDWTIGNCHFEFLIPGTTEHQVVSWELAEQLVTVDFMRSGLLDETMPIIPAVGINDSPWSEIPSYIYNELPVELRLLIGGPPDDVTEPVPIWTDGNATILNLAQAVDWTPEVVQQNLTIIYNQVIPKPFCVDGPYQYIYVQGPVYLDQEVRLKANGKLTSSFYANGTLQATPVDPTTNPPTPIGETYEAKVRQRQRTMINGRTSMGYYFIHQTEIPQDVPYRGQLIAKMQIGPGEDNHYSIDVQCGQGE